MAIQNLSSVTDLSSADQVPLFSAAVGNDVRATLATLTTWLQDQLTSAGAPGPQYSAPSATGFSITVTPATTGASVWLLLTPTSGFAAGTITLPASPVDGQEVQVSCTQAVTTLTVSGNGYTTNGAPATLAANGFFQMRFNGVFSAWYRVG